MKKEILMTEVELKEFRESSELVDKWDIEADQVFPVTFTVFIYKKNNKYYRIEEMYGVPDKSDETRPIEGDPAFLMKWVEELYIVIPVKRKVKKITTEEVYYV